MRKKYSSGFKFRVALSATKNDRTITQICQEYEVAPSLVHKWKQQLLTFGAEAFDKAKNGSTKKANSDKKTAKLYEKIGQLTIERDFLKKNWGKFEEQSD